MRRVTAIRNGTVIDHVPSGQALRVLEMLGIAGETSVPVSFVPPPGHPRAGDGGWVAQIHGLEATDFDG